MPTIVRERCHRPVPGNVGLLVLLSGVHAKIRLLCPRGSVFEFEVSIRPQIQPQRVR